MSDTMTGSDQLAQVADLIHLGKLRTAQARFKTLTKQIDPLSIKTLVWCAQVLAAYPFPAALTKLQQAAAQAPTDDLCRLVNEATPEVDPHTHQPQREPARAPRWGKGNYRAPRDSYTRCESNAKRPPRPQKEENAAVTAYYQDRAGVDDAPERSERPDGYHLDYDRAALHALRGLGCLVCHTERSNRAQTTTRECETRADDGLCERCRENGAEGVPAPDTETDNATERYHLYCARFPRRVLDLLRIDWKRATAEATDPRTPRERAAQCATTARLITEHAAAWNAEHATKATPAQRQQPDASAVRNRTVVTMLPPGTVGCGPCGQCGQVGPRRHGVCIECRKAGYLPVGQADREGAHVDTEPLTTPGLRTAA